MSTIQMNMPINSLDFQREFVKSHRKELIEYSRRMWCYFGHAGSLTPWHDREPEKYLGLKDNIKKVSSLIDWLSTADISLEAYSVFAFSIAPIKDFRTVGLWSGSQSKNKWKSWVMKLRKQMGTSDRLDHLAKVLMKFFELQIEAYGVAEVYLNRVIQADTRFNKTSKNPKCLELYHQLADRVLVFEEMGIDPFIWLEQKFWRTHSFFKTKEIDRKVDLTIIVNKNGLEVDYRQLKKHTQDPWRPIKEFLGLSEDCEFTDGYVPKGWGASSDDRDALKKVTRITGMGYYFYADGTQRRGRRHYASNSYFVIKCTPDNFDLFKASWHDPRLIVSSPTWEEYSTWGASSGWWDAKGESINGRGKPVKWRKNGPQKS